MQEKLNAFTHVLLVWYRVRLGLVPTISLEWRFQNCRTAGGIDAARSFIKNASLTLKRSLPFSLVNQPDPIPARCMKKKACSNWCADKL